MTNKPDASSVDPAMKLASPDSAFRSLHEVFLQATRAGPGTQDGFYDLCGQRVRIQVAGDRLVPWLVRALEHRKTQPGPTDWTLCAWDSISTGTRLPEGWWNYTRYLASEHWMQPQHFPAEARAGARIQVSYDEDSGTVNMLDRETGVALYCVRDAGGVPFSERSAPFRTIFSWWMSKCGQAVVHAGAIGSSTGGVLLVGKGGAGKSTSTLACLRSPLLYAGDDLVCLSDRPFPYVHSLYQTAKVYKDQTWRLPFLIPYSNDQDSAGEKKTLLYLMDGFAGNLTGGFPLSAILSLKVTSASRTSLKPVAVADTLNALVPNSIMQLRWSSQENLNLMVRIAQQIPGYQLEVGEDLDEIPTILQKLLSQPTALL